MAEPRRLTLLVTLVLLLTAVSFLGHFVADAICVAQVAAGELCAGGMANGRSNSSMPVTADLHSGFTLPSFIPPLSLFALVSILTAVILTHPAYASAPLPPPPKPLS